MKTRHFQLMGRGSPTMSVGPLVIIVITFFAIILANSFTHYDGGGKVSLTRLSLDPPIEGK